MTKLGDFWNFLATKFITKVAQMFGDFLGGCENHHFLNQVGEATFGLLFGKKGLLFIPTSGHTGGPLHSHD